MKNRTRMLSIVIAGMMAFTGCAAVPAQEQEEVSDESLNSTEEIPSVTDPDLLEESGTQMPNPVQETTQEEIEKLDGILIRIPEKAEDVVWTRITTDPVIDQAVFTMDGKEYTYRISDTGVFTDISGMYYNWIWTNNSDQADVLCDIRLTEEGQGVCSWMDERMHSISMTEGADEESLFSMYEMLYDLNCASYPDQMTGANIPYLPAYTYPGDDPVMKAVAEYIVEDLTAYYSDYSVSIPAPVIFRTEDMDADHVKVYGNFWVLNYILRDGILDCDSGGENPGYLILEKSGDSWTVSETEFAGDGSEYAEDIRRFCNGDKELETLYFSSNDAQNDPLYTVRLEYVRDYVESNDLDIEAFQDFGWDPVYLHDSDENGSANAAAAQDVPEAYLMKDYEELTDGTFECSGYNYRYKLEITGRMGGASKDSTFVYLSNIEEISFDQAWKAAGFSSNMADYFDLEDAVLVEMR